MKQSFVADRVSSLPPYLFAELDRLKREAVSRGMDVISLGIGDPDLPTPSFVIDALSKAAREPQYHQYPPYEGIKPFREAACNWFAKRFGVKLNAEQEILTLVGSKDGIAHLPLALVNPGDRVLVPDPGYPVYTTASQFAGGVVQKIPLLAENNFLPDLSSTQNWAGAKLLFVGYPNNPTSATADLKFFERLVSLAHQHGLVICHDNAYSELYFDGRPSPSILQVDGAKEVCLEMHSLSKSFNMTGWRLGFAVGNRDLVQALGKIKTNVDSGQFGAIQMAGAVALNEGATFLEGQRKVFQERRDLAATELKKLGLKFKVPQATFYFWIESPNNEPGLQFCRRIIEQCGVVLTPGVGMGEQGAKYFRLTITTGIERLREALQRISKFI